MLWPGATQKLLSPMTTFSPGKRSTSFRRQHLAKNENRNAILRFFSNFARHGRLMRETQRKSDAQLFHEFAERERSTTIRRNHATLLSRQMASKTG